MKERIPGASLSTPPNTRFSGEIFSKLKGQMQNVFSIRRFTLVLHFYNTRNILINCKNKYEIMKSYFISSVAL